LALNIQTLAAILHDLAKSLHTWDTTVLLILVNWHGGNDLLGALATEISATEDIPTAAIPAVSQVGKAWDESGITSAKDIHAGAVEASIVHAYWPELIAGKITANDHCEPDISPAKAQAVMQALGIRAVTDQGTWGAPEEADMTKGKQLIDNLVVKMRDQTTKLLELVNQQIAETKEQ